MSTSEPPALTPEHRAYLNGHAVSDEVIDAEGIRSEGGMIVFTWHDGDLLTEQRRPWPGTSGQYYWEKDKDLHLNILREPGPDAPVLLAEGTKQSLAVASWAPPEYAVYGMPGCWGWTMSRHLDLRRFAGRDVFILLDADAAENLDVWDAGERLATELRDEEPPARPSFVPSPAWGKDGIDDYLARIADDRRTVKLSRLIARAQDKPADKKPARRNRRADEPDTGGRALVLVNRDRKEVIDAITGALYAQLWQELYNFGGALTVVEGSKAEPLDKGTLLYLIPQVAACFRYREATMTSPARYDPDCWPDPQTIEAVLSSGSRFLPLRRIARMPFARPDGTPCIQPGYDEATRTLLVTDLALPAVLDAPGAADVAAAAGFLLGEWLGDMPFKDDASRANALALVLTPFIRGNVPVVPLAVVSGLQMGVGKNLLADCLAILVTGEPAVPLPYIDDENETRKQITSAFRTGADLFCFDEAHIIQGTQLARAVTSLTYQDRVLGVSKMIQFPNQVTWMSLGNQVQVDADMARRVYFIELAPENPDPQDRDESVFTHPDLRGWTAENRDRLVHAALTIIRAWYAAGCPRHARGALMGSFENWDKTMSGILGHAGVTGFLSNLAERRSEADFAGAYWHVHVAWLAATFGTYPAAFTALQVKGEAQASSGAWDAPPGLDDLTDRGFARKLGQAYARNQNRWYGPYRLVKLGTGHGTIVRWAVEAIGSQNGHVPSPKLALPGPSVYGVPGTPSLTCKNGEFQDHATPLSSVQAGYGPNDPPFRSGTDGTDGTNIARDGTDGTDSGSSGIAIPMGGTQPEGPGNVTGWYGPPSLQWENAETDGTESEEAVPPVAVSAPLTSENAIEGGIGMEPDGTDGTPNPSRTRARGILVREGGEAHTCIGGAGDIHPLPSVPSRVVPLEVSSQLSVGFDLETADAGELFRSIPVPSGSVSAGQIGTPVPEGNNGGFVRLAGLIGPPGEPVIAEDAEELLAVLDDPGTSEIYGHNILGFDGLALAWHHRRDDPGWWERFAARARDTELIARQADPPRSRESGSSQDKYDLDHVAARLGLPGKTDELKRLKQKFGGYDRIPADDPEYRAYLEGDLRATRAVKFAMAERYPPDPYLDREHKIAAIAGRMTLNGFRVDQGLLEQRLEAGEAQKHQALAELHESYLLPLGRMKLKGPKNAKYEEWEELVSPLAADVGREWLAKVWRAFGVTDPPRTDTGKLAIGGEDLGPVAAREDCPPHLRKIIELMAIVTTTRTVYQTAKACLCPDGRVHPGNSFRQASGRWSVTNPGLTVFGKRGGRYVERDIFLPDPGHVLLSCDLAQVDMRAMAGHSQDQAYMAMFAPGQDAHEQIAAQVGLSRQDAKAVGHGWNYGLGPNRMIKSGMDPVKVYAFINGMTERFSRLIEWRDEIRAWAVEGNLLDNGFGRRMRCDPSRAYTVAPALMGQGTARDIMCQSLLNLPRELYPYLRVMVHDEIVMSVPEEHATGIGEMVRDAMTWTWRSVPILCDMNGPGANWGQVSAK